VNTKTFKTDTQTDGNKMLDQMGDLQHLIQNEIPEGRSSLENSHTNLEKVAAFCEANYIQVGVACARACMSE
jgi:hypothetical protein